MDAVEKSEESDLYLISRTRVAMLGLTLPLLNFPKPTVLTGPDSSLALCKEIVRSGAKRVLVITDGPLFALGLMNPVVDALKASGIAVEIFSEIEPDPGYELVLNGVKCLNRFKPDAVIAIGGGSSIDAAKSILLCQANDKHPSKLTGIWLYALPRKKCLPFYAIPTTAGTGSEATIASVVSDKQAQIKYAIIDPKVTPLMAALDPKLMAGLPPHITGATGMDALTHAVEAFIATTATKETNGYALEATAAIIRYLPTAYAAGSNLEARGQMANASFLGGMAFTRAGVGYIHAIAHQLGGLYHVPHGLANAIVMPYILDFSKSHCTKQLAELARVSGLSAGSDDALADAFIARIRSMNESMQIPATVKQLKRSDFSKIIDRAFAEAHGTYGVPRYMSRAEATGILEKLLPA